MRLRKFDNFARIIQRAMKRFCAVRVYQRQREQGECLWNFIRSADHRFVCSATDIMFGKKERNARSLDRNYIGDYCNLHQRPDLQRLVPRNEKIEFSSYLYKYDRRFRRQGRYFISTNQALYIIDEECVCSLPFEVDQIELFLCFAGESRRWRQGSRARGTKK
jgi:hypothetical protein